MQGYGFRRKKEVRLKIKIFNPEFVRQHKVPSDYKAAHAAEWEEK